MGSDFDFVQSLKEGSISIHAPRMGSDVRDVQLFLKRLRFQSTLPAWGATEAQNVIADTALFQSTLPAWGATEIFRTL